jgi:hypothetical protein
LATAPTNVPLMSNKPSKRKYGLFIESKKTLAAGTTMDEFKVAYAAAVNHVYKNLPTIKYMYAFEGEPGTVKEVLFMTEASLPTYAALQSSPALTHLNTMYGTGWSGVCFGDWDATTISTFEGMGASLLYLDSKDAGYIRETGMQILDNPPMTIYNVRHIQKGSFEAYDTAFQALADYYYEKIPGLVGFGHTKDPNDDTVMHDYRIFSNVASFTDHAGMTEIGPVSIPHIMELGGKWFKWYNRSYPGGFMKGYFAVGADNLPLLKGTTNGVHHASFIYKPYTEIVGKYNLTRGDPLSDGKLLDAGPWAGLGDEQH